MLKQDIWCGNRSASYVLISTRHWVDRPSSGWSDSIVFFFFLNLFRLDWAHLYRFVLCLFGHLDDFVSAHMRAGSYLRYHKEQHGCVFWDTISQIVHGQCEQEKSLSVMQMMYPLIHFSIHSSKHWNVRMYIRCKLREWCCQLGAEPSVCSKIHTMVGANNGETKTFVHCISKYSSRSTLPVDLLGKAREMEQQLLDSETLRRKLHNRIQVHHSIRVVQRVSED